MYIKEINVINFRLFNNVNLTLEKGTTLIIGRNNSGKTSLTELFRRLCANDKPTFLLVDFSMQIHEKFWNAYNLKLENKEEKDIRNELPVIEIKLSIKYDEKSTDLGLLSEFIIDLDTSCTETLVILQYRLKDGKIDDFFKDIRVGEDVGPEDSEKQKITFFRTLKRKKRIENYYDISVLAQDPNDPSNTKQIAWKQFKSLIKSCIISAQRGLDDTTHKEINLLGRILENLLKTAEDDTENPDHQEIVQSLENAVNTIQKDIDEEFNKNLENLLPSFSEFGYPGLVDPQMITETSLDVRRLMKNNTRVCYKGKNGINLPESYNGLGVRNLIFILLKIYEFAKAIKSDPNPSGICMVFIEEPEVHLHPQMQEVFIRKLKDFERFFNSNDNCVIQYIVTTHSSHIANEAPFSSMKYFLAKPQEGRLCTTIIKDLRVWGEKNDEIQDFLHKYMTLTKCDLFFADKAVLIEGTSERLLLPEMIRKVDTILTNGRDKLSSQYVSIIEVGGAHAHLFFNLLNFLELRTLIITDLDSVKENGNTPSRKISCKVSEGTHTSNSCIKKWFSDPNISPHDLIQKSEDEKQNNHLCIAYQIPESPSALCGRSFEDAFMFANQDLFKISGDSEEEKEKNVWNMAKKYKNKKSDFALKYAIEKTEWQVPKYISEGLKWLVETDINEACDSLDEDEL